jgi:hypothetical protein
MKGVNQALKQVGQGYEEKQVGQKLVCECTCGSWLLKEEELDGKKIAKMKIHVPSGGEPKLLFDYRLKGRERLVVVRCIQCNRERSMELGVDITEIHIVK